VAVAGGGFGGAVAEVPVAGAPLLPTLLVSHGAGGGGGGFVCVRGLASASGLGFGLLCWATPAVF